MNLMPPKFAENYTCIVLAKFSLRRYVLKYCSKCQSFYEYPFLKLNTSVLIKLSESEKDSFKRAAELTGVGFSAWARLVLRKEAAKVLKDNNEKIDFLEK